MGNDGGSFAHRTEIVKMKKKEQKVDKQNLAQMKSGLCSLTKEPLRKPICICRLGNLYNKEDLIKKLISKSMPKLGFNHIKKSKDFKEIALPPADDTVATTGTRITCPLT